MGLGERTPLRGSQDHVPYVFMTDPNRAYKKRVRLLQCYLCTAILGVFALALLVSVMYSVDNDILDEPLNNGSLALKLKSPAPAPPHANKGIPVVNPVSNEPHDEKISQKRLSSTNNQEIEHNACFEYNLGNLTCANIEQRSADGTCNNLNHPGSWGVTDHPFRRLLPADYCDGSSAPRCASSKSELPSAFKVGSTIHQLYRGRLRDINAIRMLWGRFVYQDLVGLKPMENEVQCCDNIDLEDESCYSVQISKDDPFYPHYNTTCLPYRRSKGVICGQDGKMEQLNRASSYLDGSVIYGSKSSIQKKLRKFTGGLLNLYISPEHKFLPIDKNEKLECNISRSGSFSQCRDQTTSCISEGISLPTFNLLLAKHHNLIANQLKTLNPEWEDERLFQTARKIIIAQIQHITYNEFLEVVLGNEKVKTFGGNDDIGYYENYDATTDATVSNAFSTVFLLISSFTPVSPDSSQTKGAEACNLYELAENIQRGRDHGLPGYTKWQEYCGRGKVSNFSDLSPTLGADAVNALKVLYQDVGDIDLFVGLHGESSFSGDILGPVGSCIVAEQFKRTKAGDRHWYENSQQLGNFTRDQLAEIHKTSLSGIICTHAKALKNIQYNSMLDTDNNPTLSCNTIPSLNLTVWGRGTILNITSNLKMSMEDIDTEALNLNAYNSVRTFMDNADDYILQSTKGASKSDIIKQTTSFSVDIVNATLKINDDVIFETYNGRPPFTIPLDSFADTSSYNPSASVSFLAAYDDFMEGTITLPMKNPDFERNAKKVLTLNFTAGVSVKWGGSFTHDPKRTYSCKVMFQSYSKMSNINVIPVKEMSRPSLQADASGEQCNILVVGTYYHRPFYCPLTPWWCQDGLIFYWSGETKLIFTKPNPSPANKLAKLNKLELGLGTGRKTQLILEKTEKLDTVVEKSFASVTVIRAKVSGQFNGEEVLEVMNGSPPIDIYLDNFVNPNSFDTSVQVTWKATPSEDRVVEGTFSLPYFPSIDNYSERRKFTANFSADIIYKYGGSIGIIDPSKTYTCKAMFQANKKSTAKLLQSTNSNIPLQGKTALGESCSMTISGSFYEPSVLCFWCTKAKIFQWNGDFELAFKYKYVAPSTNSEENTLKKLGQNTLNVQHDAQPLMNNVENNFSIGHRFGGRVVSGWIQTKTGGLFSSKQTVWSGDIPFEIELPIFWTPSNENGDELSDTYGHAILWSASIFHSTIQGSFSFPQYVGHGPPPSLKWINGKFSFQLEPSPFVSLYDLIVPGIQYKSNLYLHSSNLPNGTSFSHQVIRDPSQDDVSSGVRAPVILLGKYTQNKHFVWNGSFIIDFSRSAKDLYYG